MPEGREAGRGSQKLMLLSTVTLVPNNEDAQGDTLACMSISSLAKAIFSNPKAWPLALSPAHPLAVHHIRPCATLFPSVIPADLVIVLVINFLPVPKWSPSSSHLG